MSNTVDRMVCALRKKIAPCGDEGGNGNGAEGELLATRRGLGYVLQGPQA
jgi:hypothetical protein